MARSFLRLSVFMVGLAVGLALAGPSHAQKKIRFAYPSSSDMGDVPSLLAWEQLKKQGIEVVPTFQYEWPFTWSIQAITPATAPLVPRKK